MNNIDRIRRLEEEGFEGIKRTDLLAVKINLPFDWSSDPFNDENWCFQLHTLRWLRPYINEYRQSKNFSYLIKAFKIIEDWGYFEHEVKSAAWGDMASGIRSEVIYELLCEISEVPLLALEKSILEKVAKTHHQELSKPGFINVRHNHGLFALHGLNCLNQYFVDEQVSALIEKFFIEILDRQFDSDGVHTEHSPHYHFFITATVEKYISTGLYQGMSNLNKKVEQYKKNCSGLVCHRGFELPFGDTDNKSKPSGYTLPDADIEISFAKSGYSVFRSKKSSNLGTLAATNNNNSHTHKHSDNLSMIWFVNDIEILIDPGKYTYNKEDPKRTMVLASNFHNTISLDGESWTHKQLGKLETLTFMEGGVANVQMSAQVKRALGSEAVTLSRSIRSDIVSYVSITDEITSNQASECSSRFFFHPEAELTMKKGIYGIKIGNLNIKVSASYNGSVVKPLVIDGLYSRKYNEVEPTKGFEFHYEANSKLVIELEII